MRRAGNGAIGAVAGGLGDVVDSLDREAAEGPDAEGKGTRG